MRGHPAENDDMNRSALLPIAVVAALATTSLAAASSADTSPTLPTMFDLEAHQVDCAQAQLTGPEATGTEHLTGGDEITLRVLLVLDTEQAVVEAQKLAGTPPYNGYVNGIYQDVLELFEVAPQPYEDLGITLEFVGWEVLQPVDPATGQLRERTTETQEIIDLAKEQFGGVRPDGVDIVYVATDLDIQALGQTAVAGQADCIGGVANDANAFAVGEVGDALVHPKDGIAIGPVSFYKDFAGKVFAHEVGHLMGGHHHYQECGTPDAVITAAGRAEVGACTLMSNAVDFQTLPFSTLNGLVVRGHAEQFVRE